MACADGLQASGLMLSYVARRLAGSVIVISLILLVLSMLPHIVSGDPARAILGPLATQEKIEAVRQQMGLDQPLQWQFSNFAKGAITGDLGMDFITQRPVAELIAGVFPHTLALAAMTLLITIVVGIPMGALAALWAGSWVDQLLRIISVCMITAPPYVVALLLLLAFAVNIPVFPAMGAGTFADPRGYLHHLFLPALTLSLFWTGYLARISRGSLIEVLGTDYIRAAHAYGLTRSRIFFSYALRNALTPAVALLGMGMGQMISLAVFIEVIFSRPGLGSLMIDAIAMRNYPLVRGCILVVALTYLVGTLTSELLQRVLTPRLHLSDQNN